MSQTVVNSDRRERVVIRLAPDDRQRAEYWAARHGFSSVNEYMAEAVAEQIRRENLDFDVPNLLVQRMNQLIDEIKAMSTNTGNLERVMTVSFDSLLSLARGDSGYLQDESGELGPGTPVPAGHLGQATRPSRTDRAGA